MFKLKVFNCSFPKTNDDPEIKENSMLSTEDSTEALSTVQLHDQNDGSEVRF